MKKVTPKNTNADLAHLFKVIAKLLEKESPQELANALQNRLDSKKATAQQELSLPPSDNRDLKSIANELMTLDSRDKGASLLSSTKLTRKELEGVGRILGIPIMKTDNIERLTQKIIEASIGSRLNSRAIRGSELDLPAS